MYCNLLTLLLLSKICYSATVSLQFCISTEISQAQIGHEKAKLLELHNDKPTKVVLKVKVPADEFPRVSPIFLLLYKVLVFVFLTTGFTICLVSHSFLHERR